VSEWAFNCCCRWDVHGLRSKELDRYRVLSVTPWRQTRMGQYSKDDDCEVKCIFPCMYEINRIAEGAKEMALLTELKVGAQKLFTYLAGEVLLKRDANAILTSNVFVGYLGQSRSERAKRSVHRERLHIGWVNIREASRPTNASEECADKDSVYAEVNEFPEHAGIG